MGSTEGEDLLWQWRFKMILEDMKGKQSDLEKTVGEMTSTIKSLQSEITFLEQKHSAKHEHQDAATIQARKEAQDMAEVLASWKSNLASALKEQDQRDQQNKACLKEQERRISALEAASQNYMLNNYTLCNTKDTIDLTIHETLRELLERFPASGSGGELVQVQSRKPESSHLASININLRPQGTEPFEQYLKYGQEAVPNLFDENVRYLEVEHVKAFVSNLREDELRTALSQVMEVRGWTWETFQQEAMKLTHKGEREQQT